MKLSAKGGMVGYFLAGRGLPMGVVAVMLTGLAVGASIASGGGDQQSSGSDAGAGSAVINVFLPTTRATIGAGSTITQDTPPNKLTLSRAKQISIDKWQRPVKQAKD